jgi:NADH:ubiquinone oxidoreductase subunit 2 (subunit N)
MLNNELFATINFDFINFFNIKINFNSIFLFYFFFLSFIFFLKNYFYLIKFIVKEIPFLLIGIFSFLFLLLLTTDFLFLYFSFEGLGLLTYVFLGLTFQSAKLSYEGVLKYFILNSLASIFLLFGISFLYLTTLSLTYSQILLYLCIFSTDLIFILPISFIIGFISVLISFFFKLAVFPCFI